MKFPEPLAPIALLALSLTACGGGGSGGGADPAPFAASYAMTDGTQQAVATEVNSNVINFTTTLNNAAPIMATVTDAPADQGIRPPFSLREVLADVRRIVRDKAEPVIPQAVGAVLTNEEDCPSGGTMSSSFNDSNNNGDWDVTETGATEFSSCDMGSGIVINGKVQDYFSAETANSMTDTLTFTNLEIVGGSYSSRIVSGTAVWTSTQSGSIPAGNWYASDSYTIKNLIVAASATVNAVKLSRQFTLNETLAMVTTFPNLSSVTITGSGNITGNNANLNGSVTFDITTPIVKAMGQPVAYGGQMTVSGSGGSALYISYGVPDTGSATVQLKKDGQNVGTPKVVSVSTLLGL